MCLSRKNRSALVRIPTHKPGKHIATRVELRSPDEPFARPSWLGEEVTGDPRYYNAALAACPFRCWHSRP